MQIHGKKRHRERLASTLSQIVNLKTQDNVPQCFQISNNLGGKTKHFMIQQIGLYFRIAAQHIE